MCATLKFWITFLPLLCLYCSKNYHQGEISSFWRMYSISCLWLIKLADFLLGLPELWDGTDVGMYHRVTQSKGCFEDEQTVQHPRDQRSNMTGNKFLHYRICEVKNKVRAPIYVWLTRKQTHCASCKFQHVNRRLFFSLHRTPSAKGLLQFYIILSTQC